jgi:hypothetical protein
MTKHTGHNPAVAAVLDDPYLNRGMAPEGHLPVHHRPDDIGASFATLGLGPDDVDLTVCTDAEEMMTTTHQNSQAARQLGIPVAPARLAGVSGQR